MFGLMAYPAQGIYKSAKSAQKSPVMKAVLTGRTASMEQNGPGSRSFDGRVISLFGELVGK